MSTIKMGWRIWAAIAGLALASGCVATNTEKEDTEVGGESHFLEGCTDHCEDGLECISGVCTRYCDARSDCTELNAAARCVGEEEQVCDLKCERDADCADIGSEGYCASGLCREIADQCSSESVQHFLGEIWECDDGCNTCSCHDDGLRTTALACGAVPGPPPTVQCVADDRTYQVGENWKCDCNTCFCNADGSISSTDRECAPVTMCEDGDSIYAVGVSWTCSDGCNDCTCTDEGIVKTELDCSPEEPESCDGVHLPGEMFPCDCNTCWCNEDGTMSTTTLACVDDVTCTDGDSTHQVGDEWGCSDGCNFCECTEDGQVLTTMLECPPPANCTEGFEQHVLGETWDCSDGCNLCECTESGIASTDAACLYDNCDVDGGLCAEVRPFTEWQECEDAACLCDALERCDNMLYAETHDFGSNTTRTCGTRGNTCLITYFKQGEGAGIEYHCGVPMGRGWCDSNPPTLLDFCAPVEECTDLSAPECTANDECDWLDQSSDGGTSDAGL